MTRSVTLSVNEGSHTSLKREIATAFGLAMTAMLSSAKIRLLLIIFAVVLCALPLHATVYYQVKKGDNLSKIAKRHKSSVAKIKSLNNLKSDKIIVGQKLLVSKRKGNIKKYHRVRKGDCLSNIARKYGISVPEIKSLNNLKSDKIIVGRKLLVSKGKFIKKYHRVRKGDCLSNIARKYGISVPEIKSLNNLKSDKIIVGRKLLVITKSKPQKKELIKATPIIKKKSCYYRVKKGDTIESIAKEFGASSKEIKEANLLSDGRIKPGQILVIPEFEELLEKPLQEESVENTLNKISAKVVNIAIQYLDTPYKWGGNDRNGLDCSGFMKRVYQRIGIILPRSARDQYRQGKRISRDEILPGDLLFFVEGKSYPSHVGLYLEEGLFIHASRKKKKVVISDLNSNSYYQKRLIGVRRLIHS